MKEKRLGIQTQICKNTRDAHPWTQALDLSSVASRSSRTKPDSEAENASSANCTFVKASEFNCCQPAQGKKLSLAQHPSWLFQSEMLEVCTESNK